MAKNSIGFALSLVNKLAGSEVVNKLNLKKPAEKIAYYSTRTGFQLLSTANEGLSQVRNLLGAPLGWQADGSSAGLFNPEFDEEQSMVREMLLRFAREVLVPARDACETLGHPSRTVGEAFDALELEQYALPPEFGGMARVTDPVTSALVAQSLAYGDLGLCVALLSNFSAINFIRRWGSSAQQAFYFKRLTGETPWRAAIAISEPNVPFNPLALQTKAVNVKNGIMLSGTKTMVAAGDGLDLILVAAQLPDHGVGVFAVETGTPGVTLLPREGMGLKSAGLVNVLLEDVLVDESVLLRNDHFDWSEVLGLGSLMWCAAVTGVAQAVLDYVIPYCNSRIAFGEPISHRQSVAFMISRMATDIEAMQMMTFYAAGKVRDGKEGKRALFLARHYCDSKVQQIASDGVQLLGGHGYTKEHPVERWYRDLNAAPVAFNNFHA